MIESKKDLKLFQAGFAHHFLLLPAPCAFSFQQAQVNGARSSCVRLRTSHVPYLFFNQWPERRDTCVVM